MNIDKCKNNIKCDIARCKNNAEIIIRTNSYKGDLCLCKKCANELYVLINKCNKESKKQIKKENSCDK